MSTDAGTIRSVTHITGFTELVKTFYTHQQLSAEFVIRRGSHRDKNELTFRQDCGRMRKHWRSCCQVIDKNGEIYVGA